MVKHDKPTGTESQHTPTPAGAPDEYGDTGEPVGNINPEQIAADDDQLTALQQQIAELEEKYKRALAEQRNLQRRSVENEKEARRQGITGVVGGLLSVLDNFDLALKSDAQTVTTEQVMQGVQMIRQQMLSALSVMDVNPIEPAENEPFDPHCHEAVQHVDAKGIEPGHVAMLLQTGYMLGDRVLRPAKVCVAKVASEQPTEDSQAHNDACDCADDTHSNSSDEPAKE